MVKKAKQTQTKTLFCYGCKTHVTVTGENPHEVFRQSGHVHTPQDSKAKYGISSNKLLRDLGRKRPATV